MKILQVYKNYAPTRGGIESHVRQIARGLNRRGIDNEVLVTSSDRRTSVEEIDGVSVVRAARVVEVASTPISVALIRQMARTDADIVHLHLPYPVGDVGYLVAGGGRRLVVTYHSDVVRQWWAGPAYHPLLRLLLHRASAIIATSPPYLQSSPTLSRFADRCKVVPIGVDLAKFAPHAAGWKKVRETWETPAFPHLVLFVGRFRAYKGITYLIDAMRDLPARLLLIGDGPMADRLRAQVSIAGLDQQVVFLPDIDDANLPAYYAAADAFVLPSTQRSEAYGIALLEAMASGCPIVSTELGTGTSWVNQDGITGWVVLPGSAPELSGALQELLHAPEVRDRLGREARQRAVLEFGEEHMLDQIEDIYRSVWRTTRPG